MEYVNATRHQLNLLVKIMQLCGICCVTKATKTSIKIASIVIYIIHMGFHIRNLITWLLSMDANDNILITVHKVMVCLWQCDLIITISLASWFLRHRETFYSHWLSSDQIMTKREAHKSARNMKMAVHIGICVVLIFIFVMWCFAISLIIDGRNSELFQPFAQSACLTSLLCRVLDGTGFILIECISVFALILMWYYFLLIAHVIKKELKRFNTQFEGVDSSKSLSEEDEEEGNGANEPKLDTGSGKSRTIEEYRHQHDGICHMIKTADDAFCMQIGAFFTISIVAICLSLLSIAKGEGEGRINSIIYGLSVHRITLSLTFMILVITRGITVNDLVCDVGGWVIRLVVWAHFNGYARCEGKKDRSNFLKEG